VLAAGGEDQGIEALAVLRENEVILAEADQVDFKSGFAQRTLLMYASCTRPGCSLLT
jgi:hypothetical protein